MAKFLNMLILSFVMTSMLEMAMGDWGMAFVWALATAVVFILRTKLR